MKLKNANEPVVGGWYYVLDDGTTLRAESSGLRPLLLKVVDYMEGNDIVVPKNLKELIEDQICQRQPKEKCRYTKGAGDLLSAAIHTVAGAIDAVAGTQLEKKARGCGRCGKRRMKMNSLS